MTGTLIGLKGFDVEVEADIMKGLAAFNIVGLPDASIKESKERVRSAIGNSGYRFPIGRITVNLAPANLRKEGSQLDLPIAVSLLTSMGVIVVPPEEKVAYLGELSLDGRISGVDGALAMVISLRELGFEKFVIPVDNAQECSLIQDVEIYPLRDLNEVVAFTNKEHAFEPIQPTTYELLKNEKVYDVDFSDIKGQEQLKRSLEIAAAGAHNILIIGPPGAGKTMAAVRIPTILPDLTFEEAIECTKIFSVSGQMNRRNLVQERPFRSPHHTASAVALIGGGRIPKPGEVSLAHNGVLFLDELPEFSKSVLEVLRQPMEDGEVSIARANASLSYPSDFMLVASMNPCSCGHFGDPLHDCTCTTQQITNYLGKISGPLLDRIDIHIEVQPVKLDSLMTDGPSISSHDMKARVERARQMQLDRYQGEAIDFNGQLNSKLLRKYVKLSLEVSDIMEKAFTKFNFTARSYTKVLKMARTIADLEGSVEIKPEHLLEAIRYRSLDSKYFGH